MNQWTRDHMMRVLSMLKKDSNQKDGTKLRAEEAEKSWSEELRSDCADSFTGIPPKVEHGVNRACRRRYSRKLLTTPDTTRRREREREGQEKATFPRRDYVTDYKRESKGEKKLLRLNRRGEINMKLCGFRTAARPSPEAPLLLFSPSPCQLGPATRHTHIPSAWQQCFSGWLLHRYPHLSATSSFAMVGKSGIKTKPRDLDVGLPVVL